MELLEQRETMNVGALALDTFFGYMQVRGVMPMQIVQQLSLYFSWSVEASFKRMLLARALMSTSKTGKEMDVQQGKNKKGGNPEGSLNA